MRACSGTWIAHGSGSADRDVGRRARPRRACRPAHDEYMLRRIWLTAGGGAGLLLRLRQRGAVAAVPRRPRAAGVPRVRLGALPARSTSASPTRWWPRRAARTRSCWCRTTTSRCCRRWCASKLPRATILTFWHIPWPNPESFGICPWRREILEGMLGSTILGFHTPLPLQELHRDGRPLPGGAHRARALDDLLPRRARRWSRAIRSRSSGRRRGERARGRRSPSAGAACSSGWACRRGHRLAVGVDRFDYTKGILERLHAVERLLEKHPEWIGRFTFVQVAAPTRSVAGGVPRRSRSASSAVAERINERFGRAGYRPVHPARRSTTSTRP